MKAAVDGAENDVGIQSPFCVRPVTQCVGSKIPVRRTSILTPKKVSLVEPVEASQESATAEYHLPKDEFDGQSEEKEDNSVIDDVDLKVSPVREEDSDRLESQQSSVDTAVSLRSKTSRNSILQNYRPRSKSILATNSHDKKNRDGFNDDGFPSTVFSATCLDFTAEEMKRENKLTDARYNFKVLTYEKPLSETQQTTAVETIIQETSDLHTNKSTTHPASSITWTSFSSPRSAVVLDPASTFTCTPIFRDSDPEECASYSPGNVPFSPDPRSSPHETEELEEMSCTIFSPLPPYSPASTVITMDPFLQENNDTSVLVQNENLLQDFYPNEISFFCGEVSDSAKKKLEEKVQGSPSKLAARLYRVDEKLFRENDHSDYENISDLQKSVLSQPGHQNGDKECFGDFEEEFDAEMSMLWESATDDLLSETHSETGEDFEIEITETKKTVSWIFFRFILAILLTLAVYFTATVSVKMFSLPIQQSRFTNFDLREFLSREDFLFTEELMMSQDSFYSDFPDSPISLDAGISEGSRMDEMLFILQTDGEAGTWKDIKSIPDANASSGSLENPENENEKLMIEEQTVTDDSLNDIDADFGPSNPTQIDEMEIQNKKNEDEDEIVTWTGDVAAETAVDFIEGLSSVALLSYSESVTTDVKSDLSDDENFVIFREVEYEYHETVLDLDSIPVEPNDETVDVLETSFLLAGEEIKSRSMEVSISFFNSVEVQSESEEEEVIHLEVKEADESMDEMSDIATMEKIEMNVDGSKIETEIRAVEHTDAENLSQNGNPSDLQNVIVRPVMIEEEEVIISEGTEHENNQISVSDSASQNDQITESLKKTPEQIKLKSPSSARFTVTPHGLFIGSGIFSIFSFFVILYSVLNFRRVKVLQHSTESVEEFEIFASESPNIPMNVPQNIPQDVEIAEADAPTERVIEEKVVKKERKVRDRSSLLIPKRVTRNATKNFPELLLEEPSLIRRMSTRLRK